MDNVFDLVNDFYTQDPEWNSVLQQNSVENYLRAKSWEGASEEELIERWDYITILCLYLGNTENYLGDMSREDFIDCVGWCGRNVSDFPVTAENVGYFLDVMADLYSHLRKKRIITKERPPQIRRPSRQSQAGFGWGPAQTGPKRPLSAVHPSRFPA